MAKVQHKNMNCKITYDSGFYFNVITECTAPSGPCTEDKNSKTQPSCFSPGLWFSLSPIQFKNTLLVPTGEFKRSMKVALKGSTCRRHCVRQPGRWSLHPGERRMKCERALRKSAEPSSVHHTEWWELEEAEWCKSRLDVSQEVFVSQSNWMKAPNEWMNVFMTLSMKVY